MSYRIRPGKALTGEVAGVARRQYLRAIDELRDQPDGPHEAIHAARKRFKRLRGLFRLVRDAAPDFYASENARIRDVAATLSTVRDATALVEALDHLLARGATAANHDTLFAIRDRLAERRDRIASHETDLDARIDDAVAVCEEGLAALEGLRLPEKPKKAVTLLAGGVAKTYGRAVDALATAAETDGAADWHELRKQIKYHWMHVKLLGDIWPGEMGLRARTADLAGEALGDDNDLANLDHLIATDPDAIGSEADIAILRTVMAERSAALHDEIRRMLRHLLKDDKTLVRNRIAALWRDAAR